MSAALELDLMGSGAVAAVGGRTVMGIDPGAGGALALLDHTGRLLDVRDMPVVMVNERRRVSAPELTEIVRMWSPSIAIIEKVGAMPKQGVSGMFAFGYSAGILEGVCVALRVGILFAHPATWKRAMGLSADKGTCRLGAQRMFPEHTRQFTRVRDDGRAEAAMLAAYQVMQWSARG